jgi:hypothetical protein
LGSPNVTVVENTAIAPDGSNTANLITSNDNSLFGIRQTVTIEPDTNYTLSFWARSDNGAIIASDVSDLTPQSINLTTNWTRYTVNGSYRQSYAYTLQFVDIVFGSNQLSKTFELWGAQLEVGTAATDYQRNTTTRGGFQVTRATTGTRVNEVGEIEVVPYNLFSRSEEFENIIWSKTNVSITQNTIAAPNGTLTADTLRIGVDSSSVRHRLLQQPFIQVGITYTTSYYLKKANHRWIQLNYVLSNFNINDWANFDLENGVIGNTGTGAIATITDVGNGWYRCTLQATAITTGAGTGCEIITTNNTNSGRYPSYQSTVDEDVCYVWGAQLVTGTQPKDYFPTTNRQNIPRIDYSNGSCPSILIEPQRTNLVLQNENMVITPWIYQNANGESTTELNPSGLNYSNRINLLSSSFSSVRQTIASSNNTTYTISCFFKKISGFDNSFEMRYTNELTVPNNFNAIAFINPVTKTATFNLFGTSGTGISGSITGKVDLYPNDWFRVSMTFTSGTAAASSIALFRPAILINSTTSVLVWGAQLEVGSNVTSYIPTTTAAVTRNADVITNTNASTLIGQTEGSVYFEVPLNEVKGNSRVFLSFSANATNWVRFRIQVDGINTINIQSEWYVNSVFVSQASGTFTKGAAFYKILFTYGIGSQVGIFCNGVKISTTNPIITQLPLFTTIELGHRGGFAQK